MDLQYFSKLAPDASANDIKKLYHQLIKQYHPDLQTSPQAKEQATKAMQKINAEFEFLMRNGLNRAKSQQEKTIYADYTAYMDIIARLAPIPAIKIELIGSWLWITGNTYAYRELLKELHFLFSKSKKAWFYNGQSKKTSRGRYSLNQLRQRHGAKIIDITDARNKALETTTA